VCVRELDQEEAVAEVRQPERDCRGDERQAEAVHSPVELPVELHPQRVTAVREERGVHDQRSREVAYEHAERPFVEHDDEEDRRRDRDRDIRERRRDIRRRALLDAEERRHLLVVQCGPQPDEGGDDEVAVVVRAEEQPRHLRREHDPEERHHRRGGHHVPEGGAHNEMSPLRFRRVEVEAEERALHPLRDERGEHGREGDERLDQSVVARREVPRVERQEQDAEHAGNDAAEAVDRRVSEQLLDSLEHQPSMEL
jgi:hypothetical protein